MWVTKDKTDQEGVHLEGPAEMKHANIKTELQLSYYSLKQHCLLPVVLFLMIICFCN